MSRSHVLSGWRGNRGGVPWKAARSRTTRRLRLEPLEDRRLLAVFTITNLDDGPVNAPHDLPGSLRQAIYDANANPVADEIVWQKDLSGSITLTDGELVITDDVMVTGLGDDQTTVDAAGNSRVFNIDDGQANLLSVQIKAMTITGGSAADSGGGGIRSAERLTITNSTISENFGSGLFADGHVAVTVTGSTISRNDAGSGILAYGDVAVTVTGSTISENYGGGGIFAYGDVTVTLAGSTISGNVALLFGYGGGILSSGDVTVTDSTISGNSAGLGGGGIFAFASGDVSVTDSTISGNVTKYSSSYGGGIGVGGFNFPASGNLTVTGSTISGNSGGGGGIYHFSSGDMWVTNSTISGNAGGGMVVTRGRSVIRHSTVTDNDYGVITGGTLYPALREHEVLSTIIAGNTYADVDFRFGFYHAFASLGGNLIGYGRGVDAFNQPADQTGVADPMLSPLANNGGPTQTQAPLPGSPAIDAGPIFALHSLGPPPEYDQRGAPFKRIVNGRMDVGAFEVQLLQMRSDKLNGMQHDERVAVLPRGAPDLGIDTQDNSPGVLPHISRLACASTSLPARRHFEHTAERETGEREQRIDHVFGGPEHDRAK